MRKLLYKLTDGTVVGTMAEAQASGLEYSVVLEEVAEAPSVMTAKQRANRKAIKRRNPHINSKGEYHRTLK